MRQPREKEAIQKAHDLELKKKEEAQKRYSEAVDKIERRYEKDKWNLTHAKKEEIKTLVRKAKEDPDEVDRILEEELGIRMLYNIGGKKTQSSSTLIQKSKVRNV